MKYSRPLSTTRRNPSRSPKRRAHHSQHSPNRRSPDMYRRSPGGRLIRLDPGRDGYYRHSQQEQEGHLRNRRGSSVERRDSSNRLVSRDLKNQPQYDDQRSREGRENRYYLGSDSSTLDGHGLIVQKSSQFDNAVLNSSSSPGYYNASLYKDADLYYRESLATAPTKDYREGEKNMTYRPKNVRNVSYPVVPMSPRSERAITTRKEEPLSDAGVCVPLFSDEYHKHGLKFADPSSDEQCNPNLVPGNDPKDVPNSAGSLSYARRDELVSGYPEAGRKEKIDPTHPSDEIYRRMQPCNRVSSRNVSYPVVPMSQCLQTAVTSPKEESLAHANICLPFSSDGQHKRISKYPDPSSHEHYSVVPNIASEKDMKDVMDHMASSSYPRRENQVYGYTEAERQEKVDSTLPSDDIYRMMQPSDRGDSENGVSSRKRSFNLNVDADINMKCSYRRLGEGNMWEHQTLVESPVPKYLRTTNKYATTTDVEHSSTGSKYLEFGVRVAGGHQSGVYGFGMGEAPGMYTERLSSPPRHEYNSSRYRLDANHQPSLKVEDVDAYDLSNMAQGRKSSIDEEIPRRISRSLSSVSGDISTKFDMADVEEHCNKEDIGARMQGRYPSLNVEDRDSYGLLDRAQGRKSTINEEVRRYDSKSLSLNSRNISRIHELANIEEHCNEEGFEARMQGRYRSLKVEDRDAYGLLNMVHGRKSTIDEEVRRYDSRTLSSNSRDISRKHELADFEEHCTEEDIEAKMQERYHSLKVEDRDAYGLLNRVQGREYYSRTLSSSSRDISRKHELANVEEHCNEEEVKALPSHKASVFSRLEHKKIERPFDERASGRGPASQRLSSARGRGVSSKPGTSNCTKKGLKPVSLDLPVLNDHSPHHIETSHKRKADNRYNSVDAENDGPAKGKISRLKNDSPEVSPNFNQLVQKAFLRFSKHLNETSAQRRRYTEQGKAGALICSICCSHAKEFADTRSLASHAYMSIKCDRKADHLGLHKALCVLMGWNSDFVTGNTWKKQDLPDAEALAQKENLILWPPLVIIHNSSIGRKNLDEQKVVTIEEMEAMVRDLGLSAGVTKVCRGKPANQSIMVVKFAPTYSGLQEAEKLHQYYAKNKRGRNELQQITSDSEKFKGAEGGKVELVLYGYLGISEDLDKLEIETKKRCVVESKKDILERARKS